mmetsp:Transcript_12470/g.29743  ORF Transcript_12470/g.29743 Transcript_12470/m.29743 type:complete len:268 (-) Transcript_12470:5193-5996(-)
MNGITFLICWFLILHLAHPFQPAPPHRSLAWQVRADTRNQHTETNHHQEKRTGLWANVPSEEEEEYKIKLREAEIAIAAADEAQKKLEAKGRRPSQPPSNSLARIQRTDAGTLLISIPSKGLGSGSLFTGAFSMAWFSAIIPATFASGGASLLFMLPFWAAGGMVAKNAVFDPFVSGELTVGEFYWCVENMYAGKRINQKEGPTEKLRGAEAEVVAVVNEKPQAEIKLYTDNGMTAFGLGLSIEELEYLAGEINNHLQRLRGSKTQD